MSDQSKIPASHQQIKEILPSELPEHFQAVHAAYTEFVPAVCYEMTISTPKRGDFKAWVFIINLSPLAYPSASEHSSSAVYTSERSAQFGRLRRVYPWESDYSLYQRTNETEPIEIYQPSHFDHASLGNREMSYIWHSIQRCYKKHEDWETELARRAEMQELWSELNR